MSGSRAGRVGLRWLPVLPLAAGIVLFVVLATRGDDAADTVDIHSDAPVYQSLGALVAASDLIVVAEATARHPAEPSRRPPIPTLRSSRI